MLRASFRPWGQLSWVLKRLRVRQWSVLGCLATEERCLPVWEYARQNGHSSTGLFVEIADQHSRFTALAAELKSQWRAVLEGIGVPGSIIPIHPLFDITENIVNRIESFIETSGESVILDITCLPERFFFPFVRKLVESPKVKDLLVTYSVPEKYFDGALAEDHRSMSHLPLFGSEEYPEPKLALAIIGIGFIPLGISELVNADRQDVKFKLLFPFPPGPPFYHRNWRFLTDLQDRLPDHPIPFRVEAYDVSDTFDHIVGFTDHATLPSVFAPYGPKPMSLAMCLYASQTKCPVFYTQPAIYHPEYSSGIRRTNGEAISFAYCIKLDGANLYSVNPN
jgi:hypothetical protein